ncbi:MAG TPA: histidinol-phosphatase [Dehalococcoidia bacterium]|nr:histidinol-phosphatase [Dehalococcoidia bacterium]
MDLEPYRSFVAELAERSGDLIRPFFGASPDELGIEIKADETIVTRADRGAEELMRRMIRARFPEHGIAGEEYGEERPDAEFVWSLDPIDGTISFASASPLFGTLIALLQHGQPILGAINQPVLRQLCIGDGETTTLNSKTIRVRQTPRVADATLLITDLLHVAKYQDGPAFEALMRDVKLVRTWGDCYGYLLVASGHADIMCDPAMNAWDIAPLIPIIRGAGGVISDWQGADANGAKSTIATTSQALHDEVIRRLNP